MSRFLAGVALVWAALLAWSLTRSDPWFVSEQFRSVVAAKLLGVPLIGAWIFAELAARLRCPRALDHRVRTGPALFVLGMASGGLGAVIAAAAFAAMPLGGWDVLAVGGASGLSSAGAFMVLAKCRQGTCVHCGYEVGEIHRCPECGRIGGRI